MQSTVVTYLISKVFLLSVSQCPSAHKINRWVGGIVPACVLSLVCIGLDNAQTMTTVTGHITDRQRAGVAGATVTLFARERPAERLETVTDKNGVYRFERIAPGEDLIMTEAEGFARSTAQQLRIDIEGNSMPDISLEITGAREGVVVTASGTAQTIFDCWLRHGGARATAHERQHESRVGAWHRRCDRDHHLDLHRAE